MIVNQDVRAHARQLIAQHGDDAWSVAVNLADELLAQGQLEGHRVFLRVLTSIQQLGHNLQSGKFG